MANSVRCNQHQQLLRLFLLLTIVAVSASLTMAKHLVEHQEPHQAHQHQHQHSAITHHRRRLQRDSHAKDTVHQQCEAVKHDLESIGIKLNGVYNEKGSTCGSSCCNNATESELRQMAIAKFETELHNHTSSIIDILDKTANAYQNHVLELAAQSENKTLILFSTVYPRMVPLSRMMIQQLYTEIMNHLKYTSSHSQDNNIVNRQNSLEDAFRNFFVQLFPLAYHQAVHLSKANYEELHKDYIDCLKHNYDELQPFGQIPKEIQTNLLQTAHMANIFMNAAAQTSEALTELDKLHGQHLTESCQRHLLKMRYCHSCSGQQAVKVCYSYCMNVMRGCSAQYAGLLESPWSSVVAAFETLVTTHIHSDGGIITSIRQLDGKLAEAIMRAMENGPELEKKVKKACGTPNLRTSLSAPNKVALPQHGVIKWASLPDALIPKFLSTIYSNKEFYANVINPLCDKADIKKDDDKCWTGDRVGDYSQVLMAPGTDTQRYNPEVPWEIHAQPSKLNEIVDKLIKIRTSIGAAAPSNSQSHDIQSDMGREGSGHISHISDDDEEYSNMHSSGDGSGDGFSPNNYDPTGTTAVNNDIESRESAPAAAHSLASSFTCLMLTLVTIIYSSCS